MAVRLDDELHPVLLQSFRKQAPLSHFQRDAAVCNRHVLAIHQMVMRDDSAPLTKLRIEATNKLVTVQIEVKPLVEVKALVPLGLFQTSEHLLVEASSLTDISDLKRR